MKKYLLLIIFLSTFCHAQNPILWGFTFQGGQNSDGIILNYNVTTGVETDTHDFAGSPNDGRYPINVPLRANDGLLYGMTNGGGAYNKGTIFSYNISTGIETDLHDFGNGTDGEIPYGCLIQANNGLLYGMTRLGGVYGLGMLFSYNISTDVETDLHDFGNGTDGASSQGAVIQANDSLLYGMTESGGIYGGGTIFSYNISTGTETVLHNFAVGSATDGQNPLGSLIQASNGLLYGMTETGGSNDLGVIFSYNITTATETVLHNFGSGTDGQQPTFNKLLQVTDSLLYGMTFSGGINGDGIIFNYNILTGIETDLHDFGSGTDGKQTDGSLMMASNGLLYGMTIGGGAYGGTNGDGTIFNYNITTGTETDIHDFGNGADGKNPYGSLIEVDSATISLTPVTAICRGGSVMLIATGSTTYSWAPVTGLSATTGDSVIASPTVTTTYTVRGMGTIPSYPTTVTVTVISDPAVTVNTPAPICSGESTTLIANGANTYTWTPTTGISATTGDSVIANPVKTTTYIVTGMDSLGCTSISTDTVNVIPAPPLIIKPQDTTVCNGQSVSLTVLVSGTDYLWSPSLKLSSSIGDSVVATPLEQVTYTVTGIDSSGCKVIGYDTISVRQGVNKPTIADNNNVLTTSATEGNQWYRNGSEINGATNESYTATDTGCYWDVATNLANGCSTISDTICIAKLAGIKQISVNNNQLSIYPNPTGGEIFVNISSSVADIKNWNLQITDVLGRTVYMRLSLKYSNDIDLSNLSNGMYFIAVINKTIRTVIPMVKQN